MFKNRPFSINYLGNDGGHSFFVNIGNVNEIIYGTGLFNTYIFPERIGDASFYNGIYDVLLNRVSEFGATGSDGQLNKYIFPLKKSITLSTSSAIYLKIPRIPMGSGASNNGIRPIWFASRTDSLGVNLLFWTEQFEIVSEVNPEDFIYEQRYDALQAIDSFIDFPKTKFPQKGAIYIKLADIRIDGDTVQIIPYFQSNIINPNRYITMGINYLRNCSVQYFGFIHREDVKIPVVGYYSRPDWIIKSFEEIFSSAKNDIESDFGNYFGIWDYDFEGKADFFEVRQLFAVYSVYSNDKVRVKKIFEDMDEEESFLELNEDNLSDIVPGLNSENSVFED